MTLYNIGELSTTRRTFNNLTVTTSEPSDVFKFEIGEDRNINLLLTDIQNANPKVKLYRDNGDGSYGTSDQLLAESNNAGKLDDFINRQAEPGTYFARVVRDSGRASIRYDLLLSATPRSIAPNLLSYEQNLGDLSGDETIRGSISDANVVDTYGFALGADEGVNIRLRGLTADADIRIIRDDGDRVAEPGETVAGSYAANNYNELIANFQEPGNYFLQVYQYDGETPYRLGFDHYVVSSEPTLV